MEARRLVWGEDGSLTFNVWAWAEALTRRVAWPVLVWFSGGGYQRLGLVRRRLSERGDIVVVTVEAVMGPGGRRPAARQLVTL